MPYTLEQLVRDCRTAMESDPGRKGRETMREAVARACADPGFVAAWLGDDDAPERKVIHDDRDYGFCILAHVYRGAKSSDPHDHAGTWAIYGQAEGVTEMTDWRVLERPRDGRAGKVEAARTYRLEAGQARIYEPEDVHSPSRSGPTRLIRIEGRRLDGVRRDRYEPARPRAQR